MLASALPTYIENSLWSLSYRSFSHLLILGQDVSYTNMLPRTELAANRCNKTHIKAITMSAMEKHPCTAEPYL